MMLVSPQAQVTQPTITQMASLTISPSPRPPPPQQRLKPERPKLSLNTTHLDNKHSLSKGIVASGLRIDALSAGVSPTVKNTFSNTFSRASPTPTPQSARPTLRLNSCLASTESASVETPVQLTLKTPSSASTVASLASSSSSLSSSSTDSAISLVPYKLSHSIRSILTNSPLPPQDHKMSNTCNRPRFPLAKSVSFRSPLSEEIHTTRYTLAHSDIESSISSSGSGSTISVPSNASESPQHAEERPSSSPEPSEPYSTPLSSVSPPPPLLRCASPEPMAPETEQQGPLATMEPKKSRSRIPRIRAGVKRDSSDEDSDSPPETPVAGRRKRHREWVWTLGPMEGKSQDAPIEDVRLHRESDDEQRR
ncbi:hypothetical protein K402DRAFT_391248 [Aulographum hederae CBS 113979]|uniref:Uncharacterized protein n=1 Tax=Aulographum hederae CBS 113979 TaxID=1176131 RepID=A0A6G1H7U4_9PEZI|nr:hypothetical protein K402DRAFT_391248 [Aulographum hederae CBS 113979]